MNWITILILLGTLAGGETRSAAVLSGGGSFGAMEAGMVCGRSIPAYGVVTGVSVGGFNAAILASSRDPCGVMRDLWTSIKTEDVYAFHLDDLGRSVYDTSPLRKTILDVLAGHNLTKTHTPLLVGVTSVTSLTLEVRLVPAGSDLRNYIDLLMASAAVPVLFPPVFYDGDWWWDGGVFRAAVIPTGVASMDLFDVGVTVASLDPKEVETMGIPGQISRLVTAVTDGMGEYLLGCEVGTPGRLFHLRLPGSLLDFSKSKEMFELGLKVDSWKDVLVC